MTLTNRQKMTGLGRLGIGSTIRGNEFIIHADKKDIPSDKKIEQAYLQAEAEKKEELTLEQRVARLEQIVKG